MAAMLLATGCGGPGPDPNPGTGATVHCVDWNYTYTLPAVNKKTGKEVPGFYFTCRHRKGRRHDVCVLHHK